MVAPSPVGSSPVRLPPSPPPSTPPPPAPTPAVAPASGAGLVATASPVVADATLAVAAGPYANPEGALASRGRSSLAGKAVPVSALGTAGGAAALRRRGMERAVEAGLRLDTPRPLSQGASEKVPAMELEGGRAATAPTAAQVGATMERLNGAPVEVTVREASALLARMGFRGNLLEQVQQAGFRFREMAPDEVKKGKLDGEVRGVTYEHDRVVARPTALFRDGKDSKAGPPTIALHPGVIIDLRVFVATGGRGLDGTAALAPDLGSGTPAAIQKSIGALHHEMTHARLYGMLASGQPWVQRELARIQQSRGVGEAEARDLLQETCGYHVQELTSAWGNAAVYLARGDRPRDVADLYFMLRQGLLSSPTDSYVHGRKESHLLAPESQRALREMFPSLDDGPLPVRQAPRGEP